MLRSMTGFGRCVMEDEDWTQTWEIRSVNNRYLDLKWRLPALVRGLESRFERVVRRYGARGRVEISLSLQQRGNVAGRIWFDEEQASAMLDAVSSLADRHGDTFEPDYNVLFTLPELWNTNDDDSEENEDLDHWLEMGLVAALEDWNESRATEGSALGRDLELRLNQLEAWVSQIEECAPAIKLERFAVVRDRLSELLKNAGSELEETRFLQEVVILADKLDVSEELIRLRTHLDRLRDLLRTDAEAGRRLDFTLQECFREIVTCGNKIQDIQVSHIIVECKNELEKCREQVQNLE